MSRRKDASPRASGRHRADQDADAAAHLAARGDADAFNRLCHGMQHDVWRFCWSLTGDRYLADEATQETFLRATTAIHRFRGDAPVRIWFVVLARRSVGDVLGKHKRSPEPTEAPIRLVNDRTTAVDVNHLIEELPVDIRQAFVLTQLLGFSYLDAAEVADCPVGTIRSRVFRARELLVEAWGLGTENASKEALDDNR